MGAARRSRLFLWVLVPSKLFSKAVRKLGSSCKHALTGTGRSLIGHSKLLLFEKRLLFFAVSLPFGGLLTPRLLRGTPGSGGLSPRNSNSQTSTFLEIPTPVLDPDSTLARLSSRPWLFAKVLLRRNKSFWQRLKSARAATCERRRTLSQGSKAVREQLPLMEEISSFNMLNPDSEKKLHCVKWGFLRKTCAQVVVEVISRTGMATRSGLTRKGQNELLGSCTIRAVNWKIETHNSWTAEVLPGNVIFWTILTWYRFWRARNLAWETQKGNMWPTSGRLLEECCSSCLCFLTKD